MEGSKSYASLVERIPSAFFREALDLALEAVQARRQRSDKASPALRTWSPPKTLRRRLRKKENST
jgi:hypothetical protein